MAESTRLTDGDIICCDLIKGREHYICTFHDTPANRTEALRTLGRWATTPDLSFTWDDCAYLAQRIREGSHA